MSTKTLQAGANMKKNENTIEVMDLSFEDFFNDNDMEDTKHIPDNCEKCLAGTVKSQVIKRQTAHQYRRAFSESKLLDILERDFTIDATYHIISGGDIDSLSFLKHIVRQQDIEYVLFSTWCMAMDDVQQLKEWVTTGKIGRLDAYCGEIFPGSYTKEHIALKEVVDLCGGRVAIFRNHAKIYAGTGKKFSFAIESSANINTNPRSENTTISCGEDIYLFYKEFYDGIKSFKRDYDKWQPYTIK